MYRFRFSMRTLFIAIMILCIFLALTVQFGPHVYWITFDAPPSDIVRIPSKPLIVVPINEELVVCHVGPISFELPKSLSNSFSVKTTSGSFVIQFRDNQRNLNVGLPQRQIDWSKYKLAGSSDETELSFPRRFKERADAQSSDFSFTMSHRDLRHHAELLKSRQMEEWDSIEYSSRSDMEGVLIVMPLLLYFEWSTVDRKWEGVIWFMNKSNADEDWFRYPCATFAINGDPAVFQNCSNAEIKAMIKFSTRSIPTHGQSPAE